MEGSGLDVIMGTIPAWAW